MQSLVDKACSWAPEGGAKEQKPMPTVAIVDGVAIRFYPDEHPPHFHAVFAEYAAQVRNSPPEVLIGSLPMSKLRAVRSWAGQNREGLMEAWLSLGAGRKPRRLQ